MKKSEAMQNWKLMPQDQPILKHMIPIPYKASGSTYGSCGIRIDGTPEFVSSVLSHLKELINGENHLTRLALARNTVDGKGLNKSLPNQVQNAECCYIRLHMRGAEGAMASAVFDKSLDEATENFMKETEPA